VNLLAEKHALLIKNEAKRLGFMACGIAKAERLDEDAQRLERWLSKGFHGSMGYMERNFELRVDPTQLVPGAKSVITMMMNYYPEQKQNAAAPFISKYAWGEDYHDIIRPKLNELLAFIRANIGAVEGRGFVDSAPVLERAWAVKSGLGWVGKNGNLLNKQSGSFFFLCTLITDLDLQADPAFSTDHCGTCTRCMDACPTAAIEGPALINATKCISYLTIELKDMMMPTGFEHREDNWVFGCDVCQDVCPWNRFSHTNSEPAFEPIPEILQLSKSAWEQLSEDEFRRIFKKSPIKRSKWAGVLRNLKAID